MAQVGREETPTATTHGVGGGGGRSDSLASESAPSNTNANSHPTNAKWGNACSQCAAAKAKCSRQSDAPGTKCQRCERLGKDCTSQVHRPRKKRAVRPSKTAQLEQRLNGLVDLLKATGDLRGIPIADSVASHEVVSAYDSVSCIARDHDLDIAVGAPQASGFGKRRASLTPLEDDCHGTTEGGYSDNESHSGSSELLGERPIHVPNHYNSCAPSGCMGRAQGESRGPSESDETILTIYQTHLSPLFPFVVIPVGTTVQELEQSRPFLFSAVRMVTTLTSMRSMRAQMYRLVRHVSERMLLRSERSLDLLQGILVMIGWYQYHCLMHAQLNNLIHLAASLVSDLGLNRDPKVQERVSVMVLYPDDPKPRTNEERRALLGLWYIASTISVAFGKLESIRYSPYIQQCLNELQESKEFETDGVLVHMVQLQRLMEKIAQVNSKTELTESIGGIARAPDAAYMSTFQSELDKICRSLNKGQENNKYLMVYVHSAKMRLCEPPVIDASLLAKFYKDLTALDDNTPSALDVFYRVSSGVREWFDHWFTVPVSAYFYLPVSIICQIVYAVTMLARWSKIVSPIKPLASSQTRHTISTPAHPQQPTTTTSYTSTYISTPASVPTPSPHYSRPPATSSTISTPATTTSGPGLGTPSPSIIARDISGFVGSRATSMEPTTTTTPKNTTTAAIEHPTGPNPNNNNNNQTNNLNNPLSSSIRWRETTDPHLPHIVAMLQEQLNSQPGLRVDITEIMTQLGARFQQASDNMKEASGGEPDNNMWEVSAKGLAMTKAKLERFAEFVAQGGKLDDHDQGKSEGDDAACLRPGCGGDGGRRRRRRETSTFPNQEEKEGGGGGAAGGGGGGGGGVEAMSGRSTSASGSGSGTGGERHSQATTSTRVREAAREEGGGRGGAVVASGNVIATRQSQSQWLTGQSQNLQGQTQAQGQSMGKPHHAQQQYQHQQHPPPPLHGSYSNTTAMSGVNAHHSLGAGVHGGDTGFSSAAAVTGTTGGGAAGGVGGGGQCNNLLATEFMDQLAPWLWYYGVEDWPGT
ncbi:uncharacterized protein B0T23DRAFT_426590 [Neurospora hispaniola]|uniref:Zn(2)-C6 fungal-type domain-containing protein n=1 Tax=Neurospora hispaniola TaxID=588809 RepID=A0AAJ0MTX8_9PEZI|nr:hypothetical protein B0T23DRAFT_426590 [Neurospora hispaniola]